MNQMNPKLPPVTVDAAPGEDVPVRTLNPTEMAMIGNKLYDMFEEYKKDRSNAEKNYVKNLRQFTGKYDPEIEQKLPPNMSKAYPRITRVKVLLTLARLMNLMFPGNEKNWEIKATPSADITPEEVMAKLQEIAQLDAAVAPQGDPGQAAGNPEQAAQQGMPPMQGPAKPKITAATVRAAVQEIAEERARELEIEIEDQLAEMGGDQSPDYIALVRSVLRSGIMYGPGFLHGPFAQPTSITTWDVDGDTPRVREQTTYRPYFDFISVWDLYPDMSAKNFADQEGYWIRKILTRAQLRALGRREDFFEDQVKAAIKRHPDGNYKPENFENDLRDMAAGEERSHKPGGNRYEVICYHGTISARDLKRAGAEVPSDKITDDVEAEIWMVENKIIKADINTWRKLGKEVRTIHAFVFDEDDTTLVGSGLPAVMRDSQMAVAAAARMVLDNGSMVCGPTVEMNEDLLTPDQDTTSIGSYRVYRREGLGQDASIPAIRNISIESHITELLQIIRLFMEFADAETFVNPQSGMEAPRGTAEPMRTAAGASMLRADAALPFKDVVRNFDSFTQSVMQSLITFNQVFNPRVPKGDFNAVARGATSLIAKEVRGQQMDQLATTLTDDERMDVDTRKFTEARFAVRDLQGLLVAPQEAERRRKARSQEMAQVKDQQRQMFEAELRNVLTEAAKNIALGEKSMTAAEAQTVNTALDALERGVISNGEPEGSGGGSSR
jgi:hypothetical protein